MRHNKTRLNEQRRDLDVRLKRLRPLAAEGTPSKGWLRGVRESMGLTTRQLASRLGVDFSSILRMEAREAKGNVTLRSMDHAARAMRCRLVYAIVPEGAESLEEIVGDQALALARQLTGKAPSALVEEEPGTAQVRAMAKELAATLDSRIWTVRA